VSVRAALDAARAVFAVSRGEPAAELSLPPADATGSANDLSTTHARAVAMWSAAEEVLRALLETPTLSGQALVGEARKRHWLDLSDAHALVALQGAADRAQELSGSGLPTIADDEEHALANDAWRALESAAERALPPALCVGRCRCAFTDSVACGALALSAHASCTPAACNPARGNPAADTHAVSYGAGHGACPGDRHDCGAAAHAAIVGSTRS
jgi:hypothetical protein